MKVSGRNVTVTWDQPVTNGARVLQWTVQRNSAIHTVPATQRTLTFRNLAPGNHYFVVYATNVAGQSPPSRPAVKVTVR
ncbi:fibronectin type III domain-containing protein [Nocardioides zeae]